MKRIIIMTEKKGVERERKSKTPGRIPPPLSPRKRLKLKKVLWGRGALPVISNDFLPPCLHWEIGIYARCLDWGDWFDVANHSKSVPKTTQAGMCLWVEEGGRWFGQRQWIKAFGRRWEFLE